MVQHDVSSVQKRHWCFTLWFTDIPSIQGAEQICRRMFASKDLRYGIAQVESTDGEKAHLQGYLEFSKSVRMSEVKKRTAQPTLHLEYREGSRADARAYCMSKTWKGKDKGQVYPPWHQGTWISDVRGSTPNRKSASQVCVEALLEGLEPYQIAAQFPTAFFTHSRKVIDTYRALNEARNHGIWEANAQSEEE